MSAYLFCQFSYDKIWSFRQYRLLLVLNDIEMKLISIINININININLYFHIPYITYINIKIINKQNAQKLITNTLHQKKTWILGRRLEGLYVIYNIVQYILTPGTSSVPNILYAM